LNNNQNRPREPAHKPLIDLTLAEIRKLLNLNRNDDHAIAHGLQWSTWRRNHQADARRAHVRRHLRLQTLVI
jgi:DNA-binding transcriptional MerR regulator